MTHALKCLITLKIFDISDEESIIDDQILKWIFQLIESLDTYDRKSNNIRSKAAKQGLGQESMKPQRKIIYMDFTTNNNNPELIQSLKGLILDIFELKMNILQDQTIDKFLSQAYQYCESQVKDHIQVHT